MRLFGEGKHSKQLYLIKLLAGLVMEAVLCFNRFKPAVKLLLQGSSPQGVERTFKDLFSLCRGLPGQLSLRES